jgi:hypothetical protein
MNPLWKHGGFFVCKKKPALVGRWEGVSPVEGEEVLCEVPRVFVAGLFWLERASHIHAIACVAVAE